MASNEFEDNKLGETGAGSEGEETLLYFEDLHLGKTLRSTSHSVSREQIIEFAKVWDPQPFHIDEIAASKSIFQGLTACSAHIFSIFTITSQHVEGNQKPNAIAALGFDEMRMLKPIYAGDTVVCIGTVEESRVSKSDPTRGVVSINSQLINQHDEPVFSIKCGFLVHRR